MLYLIVNGIKWTHFVFMVERGKRVRCRISLIKEFNMKKIFALLLLTASFGAFADLNSANNNDGSTTSQSASGSTSGALSGVNYAPVTQNSGNVAASNLGSMVPERQCAKLGNNFDRNLNTIGASLISGELTGNLNTCIQQVHGNQQRSY